MNELLWCSGQERIEASALFDFAAQYYPVAPDDYDGIWKWSIENTGEFWSEVWAFSVHPNNRTRVG